MKSTPWLTIEWGGMSTFRPLGLGRTSLGGDPGGAVVHEVPDILLDNAVPPGPQLAFHVDAERVLVQAAGVLPVVVGYPNGTQAHLHHPDSREVVPGTVLVLDTLRLIVTDHKPEPRIRPLPIVVGVLLLVVGLALGVRSHLSQGTPDDVSGQLAQAQKTDPTDVITMGLFRQALRAEQVGDCEGAFPKYSAVFERTTGAMRQLALQGVLRCEPQ